TYAEELYTQSVLDVEPGQAALGVLPGVAVTATLVAVGLLLVSRLAPRGQDAGLRRPHVFQLGRWRIPLAVLVGGFLLLVVGVPLGSLVYKAGSLVTDSPNGLHRSFSLGKFLEIVGTSPWRYRRELGWSMAISATAATVGLVLAIAVGWFARRGGLRAFFPLTLTAVGLALPGPLIGLAVIWLLNRPDWPRLTFLYDQSILAPVLALVVRALPPAVLILWHAFRSVPQTTLDAAALEGAGPCRQLVQIALPCRWRAVALAWLVAWVVALGDLAASVLVVPPGVTTLSIRIFTLLHYGVEDEVAGICLAQIVLFAAVTGLLWGLAKRGWGVNRGRRST
ncbi:MAG: iron ABC transporter permease, partial [Pirellulales bacterium]|nr:iron ABC transporter permease [Pirellulales bacterium]